MADLSVLHDKVQASLAADKEVLDQLTRFDKEYEVRLHRLIIIFLRPPPLSTSAPPARALSIRS
jgi:hypothetical protein